MNLLRARKGLLYGMMVVAFAMLGIGEGFSFLLAMACVLAVVASWWWEAPRVVFARWERLWTASTLGLFALLAGLAWLGQVPLIYAIVYFVVFLAVSKMYQRELNKDYTQAMALSLLLVAGAAVFNDGISFGVLFSVYVMASCVALTAQHLAVEVTEHHGRNADRVLLEGRLLWVTVALATLVLIASLGFFFTFPRVSFGFFAQAARSGVEVAGFSEDVQLGGHGTIRNDRTVVLRARFPEGPPGEPSGIYWRGVALDRFDGRSWFQSFDRRRSVTFHDSGYLVHARGARTSWEQATEGLRRVEVYLEPLSTDLLFAPGRIRALRFPHVVQQVPDAVFGRSLNAFEADRVLFSARSEYGVAYHVWAEEPRFSTEDMEQAWRLHDEAGRAAAIDAEGFTDERRTERMPEESLAWGVRHYLQLPQTLSPRVRALAEELRDQAPSTPTFIVAVEGYLKSAENGFRYTTTLPEPEDPDQDIVEAFLFDWRRGHCEYYATAMVVLLRAAGVPARLVNGFLGGDYNRVGDFWVVRQAYAHSWVEVLMPGKGWMRFDPTPSSGLPSSLAPTWFDRWEQRMDSMRMLWMQWVIEYDMEKQINLAQRAVEAVTGRDSRAQGSSYEGLRRLGWALLRNGRVLGVWVLLAFAASWFFRRRTVRRVPWSALDTGIALTWVALSYGALALWWRGDTLVGVVLLSFLVPVVGSLIAWRVRKETFAAPEQGRARKRGALTQWSALYVRLVQVVEAWRPDAVSGATTPRDAIALVRGLDPALAERFAAFVRAYEQHRFGGEEPSREVWRAWEAEGKDLRKALQRAVKQQR